VLLKSIDIKELKKNIKAKITCVFLTEI